MSGLDEQTYFKIPSMDNIILFWDLKGFEKRLKNDQVPEKTIVFIHEMENGNCDSNSWSRFYNLRKVARYNNIQLVESLKEFINILGYYHNGKDEMLWK